MATSNLALRVASAAVLAPVAIAAAYFGGWPFGIFWALAGIAVMWESVSYTHLTLPTNREV